MISDFLGSLIFQVLADPEIREYWGCGHGLLRVASKVDGIKNAKNEARLLLWYFWASDWSLLPKGWEVCHPFLILPPNRQPQVFLCPSVGDCLTSLCCKAPAQVPLSGWHNAAFLASHMTQEPVGHHCWDTDMCPVVTAVWGPRWDGEAGRNLCFCFLCKSIHYFSLVLCVCHKCSWWLSLLIIMN